MAAKRCKTTPFIGKEKKASFGLKGAFRIERSVCGTDKATRGSVIHQGSGTMAPGASGRPTTWRKPSPSRAARCRRPALQDVGRGERTTTGTRESISGEDVKRSGTKPPWLRQKAPGGEEYTKLKEQLGGLKLATVCEEAQCPNIGECWSSSGNDGNDHVATATVMLMGDTCTRGCRFAPLTPRRPRLR